MHGQERLAPVPQPIGERARLLAVEHGMGLLHPGADLLGGQGDEVIPAAVLGRLLVVLGRQVRVALHHLPDQLAGHDVPAAAVGERLAPGHGGAADVHVPLGSPLPEPVDEVGPDDVGVGLGEHVPVHVRLVLPGALDHVEELVLVKVPRALEAQGALLLRDVAVALGVVELELLVCLSNCFVDTVKNIMQLVFADLLIL